MAYPADTLIETAITNIELALTEDPTFLGNREAIGVWREFAAYLVSLSANGATGYDALGTLTSDANWIAEKTFGAS